MTLPPCGEFISDFTVDRLVASFLFLCLCTQSNIVLVQNLQQPYMSPSTEMSRDSKFGFFQRHCARSVQGKQGNVRAEDSVSGPESAPFWDILPVSLLEIWVAVTLSSWHTLPPSHTLLLTLDRLAMGGRGGFIVALGAVVFGHIVCHPVDFGRPTLSESLIELLAELLQGLIISLTKCQRILLRQGGTAFVEINQSISQSKIILQTRSFKAATISHHIF